MTLRVALASFVKTMQTDWLAVDAYRGESMMRSDPATQGSGE